VIVLVEVWKLVGNFARLICPLPGQTNSARKFHSYNHNNKRFFFVFLLLSKNKFIPCCDDERCESVEFSATSARSSDCDKGVLWVDCVYLGYFPDIAAPSASCGFFILTLQQYIRSLFGRSSQRAGKKIAAGFSNGGLEISS